MLNDVMNWLRGRSRKPSVQTPKGGTRLQAIFLDRVDEYLGDHLRPPGTAPRRDLRSNPLRDSKGTLHDPILAYRTFVNYSRFYKAAKAGQRECWRRCPEFYLTPEGVTPT